MIVIDRGDLVSQLLNYMDDRLDDVILLKISDVDYPTSINLLQLANHNKDVVIGEIVRLLNLLSSERLSDRMILLLRRALRALLFSPTSTLADVESFFFNSRFREQILTQVQDEEVRYFWKEHYPKDEKIFRSSVDGIITRLEQIVADPMARNILCQKETRVPIHELANGARNLILLLDLNAESKISPLVAELIARVVLIIIHGLALSRPLQSGRPIFLFLDEVQTYLEPFTLAEILVRGAKYGLHLCCAFQYLNQVGDFWQGIEGNVGSIFSFTCGADDAKRLSKSFPGIEQMEFVKLPRFNLWARVNDDEGTYCFKVKTLPPPEVTTDFSWQIIQQSRQRYALPRAEVEAAFKRERHTVVEEKKASAKSVEGFEERLDPLF